jgi:hypothetical protein
MLARERSSPWCPDCSSFVADNGAIAIIFFILFGPSAGFGPGTEPSANALKGPPTEYRSPWIRVWTGVVLAYPEAAIFHETL